jgi:hypothetical protein
MLDMPDSPEFPEYPESPENPEKLKRGDSSIEPLLLIIYQVNP